MEAANIDWTTVESEYVCDEFYEHIEAPKWLDLSVPSPPVDDEAWFCLPSCRHPKNAEDFKRFSPSPEPKPTRETAEPIPMPLGERNRKNQSWKKKGGILRTEDNAKNFGEDLENQNPNLFPISSTRTTPKRLGKVLKEALKSSAEKEDINVEIGSKKKSLPKLKSTLSARNLFSGRDILGQILEFCSEIKKMAVSREKTNLAKEEAEEELLESPLKKNDVLPRAKKCSRLNNNKIPKSLPLERGILQDLDRTSEEKGTLVKKDENRVRTPVASNAEGSSVDMFWFFKPCTHSVK